MNIMAEMIEMRICIETLANDVKIYTVDQYRITMHTYWRMF